MTKIIYLIIERFLRSIRIGSLAVSETVGSVTVSGCDAVTVAGVCLQLIQSQYTG